MQMTDLLARVQLAVAKQRGYMHFEGYVKNTNQRARLESLRRKLM